MEQYFQWDDLEDYYRAWYAQLPVDWETFKQDGIWTDPDRPLDYELYERELTTDELVGTETDPATGIVHRLGGGSKQAVGIVRDGRVVRGFPTPTRTIMVEDPVFPLAAEMTGLSADDPNAQARPLYFRVPDHEGLGEDEYVFTTFKWNVHTQGRSADWAKAAEIVHTNHAWMAAETAERVGVETGDWVEITTFRPGSRTDRSAEPEIVGVLRNRVRVVPGQHPRVIACAHHAGHWERGATARAAGRSGETDLAPTPGTLRPDLWWARERGGVGNGEALNDVLPIHPQPLVGGQNWFDTVCRVRRLG